MRIVSIGEVLWDVFPDARHIGGAPFNFAAHAARLGHQVHFISAVGDDELGKATLAKMRELGMATELVALTSRAATGQVTVQLDAAGQPRFTIHRPAAYDYPNLSAQQLAALGAAGVDWVALGTLAQTSPVVRQVTEQVLAACPRARRFYDVNLRPGCFTPGLIAQLAQQATVVKLNDHEAEELPKLLGDAPAASLEDFCRRYAQRFGWEGVVVTCGAAGCLLSWRDELVRCPGYPVKVADTVGSGDAFSAAFLHGVGQGWECRRIGDFANRLGALVASQSGAVPPWTMAQLAQVAPTSAS